MPQVQATITTRIDMSDKKNFDKFCKDVGLNTSTAINLFIKTVLREKRIPFEISQPADPFFTEPNLSHLKKSIAELKAGQGVAHELIEVADE